MKIFSVLNNKLLTIAPTSHAQNAASFAVLAGLSKTIKFITRIKFFY